jgi:hypothetical protein
VRKNALVLLAQGMKTDSQHSFFITVGPANAIAICRRIVSETVATSREEQGIDGDDEKSD